MATYWTYTRFVVAWMHVLKVWSLAPDWMHSRWHWGERCQAIAFEHPWSTLLVVSRPTYFNPAFILRFYLYFILLLSTALYILLFTNIPANIPRANTCNINPHTLRDAVTGRNRNRNKRCALYCGTPILTAVTFLYWDHRCSYVTQTHHRPLWHTCKLQRKHPSLPAVVPVILLLSWGEVSSGQDATLGHEPTRHTHVFFLKWLHHVRGAC